MGREGRVYDKFSLNEPRFSSLTPIDPLKGMQTRVAKASLEGGWRVKQRKFVVHPEGRNYCQWRFIE